VGAAAMAEQSIKSMIDPKDIAALAAFMLFSAVLDSKAGRVIAEGGW
jgi:hypothetical protein